MHLCKPLKRPRFYFYLAATTREKGAFPFFGRMGGPLSAKESSFIDTAKSMDGHVGGWGGPTDGGTVGQVWLAKEDRNRKK